MTTIAQRPAVATLATDDELAVADTSATVTGKASLTTLRTFLNTYYAQLAAANTFAANARVPRLEIDNANNYIDADASGIIQLKATSITLADSAFLTIGNIHAVLFIVDVSSGALGIMYCRGAYNATQELLDVSGRFSVTKDTATSINVYWDAAGNYVLQNKIGASRILTIYELLG